MILYTLRKTTSIRYTTKIRNLLIKLTIPDILEINTNSGNVYDLFSEKPNTWIEIKDIELLNHFIINSLMDDY